MNKETVIIEQLDFEEPNRVSATPFDILEKQIIGTVIEVNTREKIGESYNIVGETVNGKIRYFGEVETEEFDYKSYSGVEEDD